MTRTEAKDLVRRLGSTPTRIVCLPERGGYGVITRPGQGPLREGLTMEVAKR